MKITDEMCHSVTDERGFSITLKQIRDYDPYESMFRDSLNEMGIPMITIPLDRRARSTMDEFELLEFLKSLGDLTKEEQRFILDQAVYYAFVHQNIDKDMTFNRLKDEGMFLPEVGNLHFNIEAELFINDLFSRSDDRDMGSSFQEAESFLAFLGVLAEKHNLPFIYESSKGDSQGEEWLIASWVSRESIKKHFRDNVGEAKAFIIQEVEDFESIMVGDIYECEIANPEGEVFSSSIVFGFHTEEALKAILEESTET